MPFVHAGGHKLEYEWTGPDPHDAPTLVFLHEGLGCAGMWRDFPAILAARTGCGALVYSRWGHGASDALDRPRHVRFMHEEALVTLPEILGALEIRDPILVGHSDGGSIALIYAGQHGASVKALILEAPHVFVEDLSVKSIAQMKTTYETMDLGEKLARYHGPNTEMVFRGWNDIWLHPAFRSWNIEESLPGVRCPLLLIQGEDDEYGSVKQVEAIVAQVSGPIETLLLPACGHAPHRDHAERVLAAATRFLSKVTPC